MSKTQEVVIFDYISLGVVSDVKVSFTKDFDDKLNRQIKEFVDKLSSKKQSIYHYKEKRNADITKAKQDNFDGKKAEYFASKILTNNYDFPLLLPDMEIREGARKCWSCDLPYSKKHLKYPDVHVKSCNPITVRYVGDYSWTFQYGNTNDCWGRDKIFNLPENSRDLVVLVFLESFNDGVIKAIVPWNILRKYFTDPKKESLKGLKKCISYKDLVTHKEEIEQYSR